METKTVNTSKHSYLFINRTSCHRYGFTHISNLLRDGIEIQEGRAHWVNRTWENYYYQSSMRNAVYRLIEIRRYHLENRFKEENGYKKLTAQRREVFEKYCQADPVLIEYNELMAQL